MPNEDKKQQKTDEHDRHANLRKLIDAQQPDVQHRLRKALQARGLLPGGGKEAEKR